MRFRAGAFAVIVFVTLSSRIISNSKLLLNTDTMLQIRLNKSSSLPSSTAWASLVSHFARIFDHGIPGVKRSYGLIAQCGLFVSGPLVLGF